MLKNENLFAHQQFWYFFEHVSENISKTGCITPKVSQRISIFWL